MTVGTLQGKTIKIFVLDSFIVPTLIDTLWWPFLSDHIPSIHLKLLEDWKTALTIVCAILVRSELLIYHSGVHGKLAECWG